MKLEELQRKLEGTYDFDNAEDCKKVIEMLLRDLSGANKRAGHAATQLRMLAMMVVKGKSEARKKAEDIMRIAPKCTPDEVMGAIMRLGREMDAAGNLTDEQLMDDVMRHVWSDLDFTGRPSALIEEMMGRFKKLTGVSDGNTVS